MRREPRTHATGAATRGRRGRLRLVALFAAVGALITLLAWAVPALVHHRAIAELEASGFVSPSLRVRHVDLRHIRLTDVKLGPDLVIDEADLGVDLLAGKVESLTLIGARWTAELTPEALGASTPALILRESPGASDEGAPPRVRIVRSEVVIGGSRFGVEGEVAPQRGRARLRLTSALGEHDVQVRVRPGDGETRVEVRASSKGGDRMEARVRFADDERADLTLFAQLGPGERTWQGHRARLAGASVKGHASIASGRIESLALDGVSESVSIDGVDIGGVAIDARREGDAIVWAARAKGEGDLHASLGGRWPNELARIAGAADPVRWELAGSIPSALVQHAWSGVELEGDPEMQLSGVARLEGERVALDEVTGSLRVPGLRAPGASLALSDVELSVAGRGTIGEGVELVLDPRSRLSASRASIADLHARGLALTPHVRIDADAHGARVTALEPLRPGIDRLAIGEGRGALRFHRVRATLGEAGARIADVIGREARIAFHVDARASRVSGILRGRDVRARGDLDASLSPRGDDVRFPITAEVASLREPESESALSGASVTLPLEWRNGALDARGRVRADRIAWRDVPIGPISGSLRVADDRVALAWTGHATRTSQFRLTVGVRLGAKPSGSADVRVRRAVASEADPISRVLAAVTDMRITGALEGALHVPLAAPERGRARLTLDDAEIVKLDGGGSARGVRGTLDVTRLVPLESAPAHVAWSALSVGDVVTTGPGSAQLRLEAPRHVAIRDMHAELAGGRVRLAPFRFDREAPDVPLRLTLHGVQLEEVLQALTKGRATGHGRLDGTLAFRVKLGDERRLVLGDGRLRARGPGRLRIDDLAKVAPESTSELDAVMDGQIIQKRVLEALSDFHYRQLVLTVDAQPGTSRVRARVVGRGARTPQELDVTLNLRGIQPLLDHALRLWPDGDTNIEVRR